MIARGYQICLISGSSVVVMFKSASILARRALLTAGSSFYAVNSEQKTCLMLLAEEL